MFYFYCLKQGLNRPPNNLLIGTKKNCGAFGNCFGAYINNEKVLVKKIHEKVFRSIEVEALKALGCGEIDTIVKYINAHYVDSEIWIIQQYVNGPELWESLRSENGLHEEICHKIFIQLVDTLEYIHRKKYIHGDLKPENIIFADNKKDKIKIVDFGAAQ